MVQNQVCWEVWDNYQKQTYRNRCYICTDQGKQMLTIPIKHAGGTQGRQLYRDVRLDDDYPWQRSHWRSLQTAYRSSPFFEFYEEDLEPLFTKKYEFLMDFNFKSIEILFNCLQITLHLTKSEKYVEKPEDLKDGRFLVNAKKEHKSTFREYTQVFKEKHGFISNVSTLDLLFNEGNNALAYLEEVDIKF